MTLDIIFLLLVLVVMIFLLLTEKLPVELTAFLGLVVLIVSGYLGPEEAFKGFGSSAVITMLSMFIVSGGLFHTGLADLIGSRIHALVGSREVPLIIAIMLLAGGLSTFMNNIAAATVLMPAVASMARHGRLPASRLFMPLSFGAILGGTITSVGTPPNILTVSILEERGLEPFKLFDFAPIGAVFLLLGVCYMVIVGRRYLPYRQLPKPEQDDLVQTYKLDNKLFYIRIPEDSHLDGLTLGEIRLGTALGVQVTAILRDKERRLAPEASTFLRSGDVLLVEGEYEDLEMLLRMKEMEVKRTSVLELPRLATQVTGVRVRVASTSSLVGQSLRELNFRERFGVVVVGMERDGNILREKLADEILHGDDEMLALGTNLQIKEMISHDDFLIQKLGLSAVHQLQDELFVIQISKNSPLVGLSILESHIGELAGVTVAGIIRKGKTYLAFSPEQRLKIGDRLLVAGEPARIIEILQLGEIQLEPRVVETTLESGEVGVVEAVVAPRSNIAGKTLRELFFRERYGLQVLALWKEGKPIYTHLGRRILSFGDAVLLQGLREKVRALASDPDFLVLSEADQAPKRTHKIPFVIGGLLLMVVLVVSGLEPIHVSAFAVATLMLLTGTLTMQEAYRSIEWRAIFLVAALLPLGLTMERSGAASLLAKSLSEAVGPIGPYAVLVVLICLSSLLSQCLDGAPAVVILSPIVIQVSGQLGVSPYPLMMGVSLAASAAFITPFSHKANLLVMGSGGYYAFDYVRVGTPLTILLLGSLVLIVPLLFPF